MGPNYALSVVAYRGIIHEIRFDDNRTNRANRGAAKTVGVWPIEAQTGSKLGWGMVCPHCWRPGRVFYVRMLPMSRAMASSMCAGGGVRFRLG
jgi:hypothetical protein